MANIIEYVKYYRNKSFDEVSFNEVDALIFANISYINFNGYINKLPVTINELGTNYFFHVEPEKIKKLPQIERDSYNLFKTMKDTLRYKNLLITDYQKKIDGETQFGAITIRSNDWVYISFEGTNSYVSGWKEDCHLSHQFPIPSQILAKEYISRNVKLLDRKVYIGGHSKGANLAVAGAMMSSLSIKSKITSIYDFDGPGMREREFNSSEYKLIEPKIKKYLPSQSIVGMLMYSPDNFKTINSTSKLILQHNPFTWTCFGSYLIEDSLSRKSIKFGKEIKEFVKEYKEDDMQKFVYTLFKVFKKAEVEQFSHFTINKMAKCVVSLKDLKADQETKEKIFKLFNILTIFISKKSLNSKK